MDENYLDDLLNGVSGEDDNGINYNVNLDSGVDIDLSDIGGISLDEFDDLDSVDLSSLELDDIDFDDVDVTSLSFDNSGRQPLEKDEDFDFDSLLEEASVDDAAKEMSEENSRAVTSQEKSIGNVDDFVDSINFDSVDEVFSDAKKQVEEDTDYPEVFDDFMSESEPSADSSSEVTPLSKEEGPEAQDTVQDVDSMDLDDLFSALGIEDENSDSADSQENYEMDADSLDELFASSAMDMQDAELMDIEDISEVKNGKKSKRAGGKRSISEILFGEPDEDDEEEEKYLAERKIIKDEQKAKKAEQKEIKKAQNIEKKALKQNEADKKKKEKAAVRKQKEDEMLAELEKENAESKPVSTPVVIAVFAAFILLAVFVVFGTKSFDYHNVIKKATDYFERQRYRLAYDEISGVEVKKDDEELRDRIYTVMYVERLYESYENNIALNRADKALDALLRGIEKYDAHYAEAVELNIVDDIDICRQKIISALWNTYGITEESAYAIIELKGKDYTKALLEYCDGLNLDQ